MNSSLHHFQSTQYNEYRAITHWSDKVYSTQIFKHRQNTQELILSIRIIGISSTSTLTINHSKEGLSQTETCIRVLTCPTIVGRALEQSILTTKCLRGITLLTVFPSIRFWGDQLRTDPYNTNCYLWRSKFFLSLRDTANRGSDIEMYI